MRSFRFAILVRLILVLPIGVPLLSAQNAGSANGYADFGIGSNGLISIAVSPANPSVQVSATEQFHATGTFTGGQTQDITKSVTWSSSAPAVAAISNAAGTQGQATALAAGATTIKASHTGISGTASLTVTAAPAQANVYVVFPPASGVNNTHFMNTVMNQPTIAGVTVPIQWTQVETGTPGPGTCTPSGTDVCQQDAFGWTHTYNWSTIDSANEQWFAAQSGAKKVNMLLFGISGASDICQSTNTCSNRDTPYYVTTSSWVTHTAAATQDFINSSRDGCSDYAGLVTTSMTRSKTGVVTVTENAHGYKNGDAIWISGTTPASYNIAQENVTDVQVASNILTITASNSIPVGTLVTFRNLKKATFLNGDTVTVLTASSTQFTATLSHANYGPTKETAGTANPQGVTVQNATTNTFQYQTAVLTAGKATTPGTVISVQQSWPVPYEAPYTTAWEAFIAAAVIHFNHSPNLSQIAYMRIGRSVGGEAYPYCTGNLELLPAPNTYTKAGWLQVLRRDWRFCAGAESADANHGSSQRSGHARRPFLRNGRSGDFRDQSERARTCERLRQPGNAGHRHHQLC